MKYLKKGFILMVIGLLFLACGSENNPTRPRKTVQKPLPAIELTLKNYKKIALSKKYSFVPTDASDYDKSWEGGRIPWLTWGTVSSRQNLLPNHDFPPNTPPFQVAFYFFKKEPYATTHDGKVLIGRGDVVAVRVKEKPNISRQSGGKRGKEFRYTLISCEATLVGNLTHPERKVSYPR